MTDLKNIIENSNRLLFEVELDPIQGDRFQPTGFPDIQAATYKDPSGRNMLLLESAQSMANRLEKTIIGKNDLDVVEQLKGLSYVVAELSGKNNEEIIRTSSLTESHRMASSYILTDDFWDIFQKDSGYSENKPLEWNKLAKTVLKYDINSLIHGVFFSNKGKGRIRFPRIISAFIEAADVTEVMSGGVNLSIVSPTGDIVIDQKVKEKEKNIYGNVPYHRTEYTAKKITAYFNIDIATLRSYSLGENAEKLIINLCLYKIKSFLEDNLRLRTACDLKVKGNILGSDGFTIPEKVRLLESIQEGIKECKELFCDPSPLVVKGKYKKSNKKEDKDESENNSSGQDGENSQEDANDE